MEDRLKARGDTFRKGFEIATRDPFHGYKNAIDDQLEDAVAVLDAFHVVNVRHEALSLLVGLIELARRVAQGFRHPDNYRLRMLLIGGGLRL